MADPASTAAAFAAIDAANAESPACLLYGQRMTAVLAELEPNPSEALAIAVRAQHIRRFEIPRATYPEGLVGYKKWRAALARFHAELAGEIAVTAGFSKAIASRVGELVRKQRLGSDEEAQLLEDTACIVFFRYDLAGFAADKPEDKVVAIVGKTLAKMSPRGRSRLEVGELSSSVRDLVARAAAQSG